MRERRTSEGMLAGVPTDRAGLLTLNVVAADIISGRAELLERLGRLRRVACFRNAVVRARGGIEFAPIVGGGGWNVHAHLAAILRPGERLRVRRLRAAWGRPGRVHWVAGAAGGTRAEGFRPAGVLRHEANPARLAGMVGRAARGGGAGGGGPGLGGLVRGAS